MEITVLRELLMVEVDIKEAFSELFILVDDKPVQINVIGILKSEDREFVVLSDMAGLIAEDEYIICELIRENELKFEEVEDDKIYDELCDLWELHLDGLEVSDIDS